MDYLLDTNAYALIFQSPKGVEYSRLESVLLRAGVLDFHLPEIVSMEIHSVIGKYRRGGAARQEEQCSRQVSLPEGIAQCGHTCVWPKRIRMKDKVFRGLQKLMSDIEGRRGGIQATLMPLTTNELSEGRRLLVAYSHLHAFGSHDALVAATMKIAIKAGKSLTLVTSDRGLKAVASVEGIPVFDPNIP